MHDFMIFADGACKRNPGPGAWAAILIKSSGKSSGTEQRVKELAAHKDLTTNNEMELTAVISALQHIQSERGSVLMLSDSEYVISGITKWIPGWKARGWNTSQGLPVVHAPLWQALHQLVEQRKPLGVITWQHVRGHIGVVGNERADEIASAFCQTEKPSMLYDGDFSRYPIKDILHWQTQMKAYMDKPKSSKKSHAKAYCYLSLVDDIPMRHESWEDCFSRVKGQSKAKYKKAISPEDQEAILASWGQK